MKNLTILKKGLVLATTSILTLTISAREKAGVFKASNTQKVLTGCLAPKAAAELSVNNVRAIVFSGSDMWWDLFGSGNAWYAVPKTSLKSDFVNSTFAGNVWFGGIDAANNLKVAAQTYRQDGIDFWTGPLNTTDASIDAVTCSKYDKIFKLYKADVEDFYYSGFDGSKLTQEIKDWPGNGDISLGHDPILAPWADANGVPGGDGLYSPESGDYPLYDVNNSLGKDLLGQCKAKVYGDETLWWVYNDNGSVHQSTQSPAIGLEVRAQAFAFKTTDEINNMTFYNYQIINRSSGSLTEAYMTVWTDADLGCYLDDYIGCDVKRGLGYVYNADNIDEDCAGTKGYGDYMPALGCDFFQGPINVVNGIDDDHDNGLVIPGQITGIDEPGEQMGMTNFMYFNNNVGNAPPKTLNPATATDYYNFMRCYWLDGSRLTYGGNGYSGNCPTNYAFPDDTDPTNVCSSAPWTEAIAGNVPTDRRFLQSAGPFTLDPGAVNYVTVGMPWARSGIKNSNTAAIPLLKIADDKAQALFDACFQVISGPEAPDITIQEMSNELILYFTNKPSSNNYLFKYQEKDPNIVYDTTHYTSYNDKYNFEGFVVYQLKNETVGLDDLNDGAKAQLVFQSDLANGVKRLVNFEYDGTIGADVPKVKVDGIDNGIQTTFRFTKDMFSGSVDQKVVNNKSYYFLAVAYGYNNFGTYVPNKPFSGTFNDGSFEGQKKPYIQGRKNKRAIGVPQDSRAIGEENLANSVYGYGPKITRVEGQGNGGNYLDLTQESINAIINNNNGKTDTITYENGKGPIGIKIVDPLNVPNTTFGLKFVNRNWTANKDTLNNIDPCKTRAENLNKPYNTQNIKNTYFGNVLSDSTTWVLTDLGTGKTYVPCKSIKIKQEYYFSDLGISVNIGQSKDVADVSVVSNPLDRIVQDGDILPASMEFSDPTKVWLTGVKDEDDQLFPGRNWIRAGTAVTSPAENFSNFDDYKFDDLEFIDPNGQFEKVLDGTWAPYVLTAATKLQGDAAGQIEAGPAWDKHFSPKLTSGALSTVNAAYDLRGLSSVNVVITADKSKWTRALVLEQNDNKISNPSGAAKLEPRRHKSVDKQGIALGAPGCNTAEASVDSVPGQPFLTGLSWFPGYAVNLETGERLNIAFGEDSYQDQGNSSYLNNGNDMMWNPTSIETGVTGYKNTDSYKYQFGGRHYIYVFGNNRSTSTYSLTHAWTIEMNGKHIGVGNYSKFAEFASSYKSAYSLLSKSVIPVGTGIRDRALHNIWTEAMWVNVPLLKNGYGFKDPANIPCDVTVKLRVSKGYKYGQSGTSYSPGNLTTTPGGQVQFYPIAPVKYSATTYTNDLTRGVNSASTTLNGNFGYYMFNTADVYSLARTSSDAKSALDLINIVPNPYYGYSKYENNRTENLVRLTNLPNTCKIRIYTLNGTLIRTYDRDVSGQFDDSFTNNSEYRQVSRKPYFEWDMKNQNGILIASGLYIIHIDVPGVGEKILKWFGVMRPLDLENY